MVAVGTSPFTDDEMLDLVDGVGQVAMTVDWEVYSSTGVLLGTIHPVQDSAPSIDLQTDRAIMRTGSGFRLNADDFANLRPLSDQIQAWLRLETGTRYPLGRFYLGDYNEIPFSYGSEREVNLYDRTLILDQGLERTVTLRRERPIDDLFIQLCVEVGITEDQIILSESPAGQDTVADPIAWPAGTSRYEILSVLASMLGCYPPFFDAVGIFHCKQVPDLTTAIPIHFYNSGGRIIAGSMVETDDSYRAPNRYIVTGGDSVAPTVGIFDVPSDAPHSRAQRGFYVTEVIPLQGISSSAAAHAAAIAAYTKDVRSFRTIEFDSTPDPRHNVFDVVQYRGLIHLETAWTFNTRPGELMHHRLARVWQGDVEPSA